jgi:hypothetical protein
MGLFFALCCEIHSHSQEEDFSRHMSGLTFYDKDEKDVNRLLSVAEERLFARQKPLKAPNATDDQKRELEVTSALLARIKFSRVRQQLSLSLLSLSLLLLLLLLLLLPLLLSLLLLLLLLL